MLRSVQKSKDEQTVYPVIAGMAIGNPQYRCTQNEALQVASKCPGLESIKPVLERIYGNSRIGSRYFAVPDFTPARAAKGDPLFYPADGSYQVCAAADKRGEGAYVFLKDYLFGMTGIHVSLDSCVPRAWESSVWEGLPLYDAGVAKQTLEKHGPNFQVL